MLMLLRLFALRLEKCESTDFLGKELKLVKGKSYGEADKKIYAGLNSCFAKRKKSREREREREREEKRR